MKFSLILNSRQRPVLLHSLLRSLHNTTCHLDDIQVFVSCDSDDNETYSLSKQFKDSRYVQFEFIERELNLHKRLNSLAFRSDGKYIFVLNDDCEMLTPSWDKIAYTILENTKHDIICGQTHDNSCDKSQLNYASFPIISRKAVEIVGFFMPDSLPGLGGDVFAYRLYNNIDRLIDIPINISHVLHTTVEKVMTPDTVAVEMRQNSSQYSTDYFTSDMVSDVKRLQDYLCPDS